MGRTWTLAMAAALAISAPGGGALAQQAAGVPAGAGGAAAPAGEAAASSAAIDPAKLRLAQTIVANVISDDQLNTMFGSLQDMLSSRMMSSFVPPDQLQKARADDPYFDERMKRIGAAVGGYMKDIMADLGPEMRRLIADSLARRESMPDLQQQAAFFSTPAGRHLFDAYYRVMSDPQYLSVVAGIGQRIAAHAGDLQKRIADAMAGLPPPPNHATPAQPPK